MAEMGSQEGDTEINIDDDTDLTGLVGSDGKFKALVSKCFTDNDIGNTTWGAAKTFTMKEFVEEFAGGASKRKAALRQWIGHYGLEDKFKPEEKQGQTESDDNQMDVDEGSQTKVVAFDVWKGLPNGGGVSEATALPQANLVDKLLEAKPGVYWLESPPRSGKTALGHIMKYNHDWHYFDFQNPMTDLDEIIGTQIPQQVQAGGRFSLTRLSTLNSSTPQRCGPWGMSLESALFVRVSAEPQFLSAL